MIKINNLEMKYGSDVIFKNFNHEFKDGTITAIMGPSGKGKTTLIRCIAGLNKPTNGEVLYNDKVIKKPHKDIFMMHQHYANYPWKTCLENVLFPIAINRKITIQDKTKALALLDLVGLTNAANKFPSELSGGMNQRLAFARLLMAEPKVILMDEPMSALDKETRQDMQNILLDLNKKTNNTIIMITHDLNEANKLASEIINF